jgi:ribosomal-protein-alanine N-acetyltransferase
MLTIEFGKFPLLQTGRCSLREISDADADVILFLRSDDAVMRYLDKEKLKSIEEAKGMIEKIRKSFENNEGITWAISFEGKMIGHAGIWRIDKEHHRGEIGYTLNPAYWNRGLMYEVMKEIIHFGFSKLNLHSLEANVNPSNQASIALLEKLSFIREAYYRENYFYNGKFLDSVIYSRLAN